jgi:hypothetical protein
MAEHIPFVTGAESLKLAVAHYSDSEFVRIQLEKVEALTAHHSMKLWLDPGIDGLDNLEQRRPRPKRINPPQNARTNAWYDFMQKFRGFNQIGAATFWIKPDSTVVDQFVMELLDFCIKFKPVWLTIPQLPIASDSSRNKINITLAKATAKWKSKRNFSGRLILPLIFTHQDQLNGKTERNPKVTQAGRCYHEAQADGFWVVDSSLTDDNGSKTLRNTRFPGIVCLHTELNEEISSQIKIAGPYWGLNLVLWARGLVDYPMVGMGNSYQYFLAGGIARSPAPCLAVASLRRLVGVGLGPWLDQSMKILGVTHPAYVELANMRKHLGLLSGPITSRTQVAKFYKNWFDLIASKPRTGRSLALFQDLSAAYALGKSLPDFEKGEKTARRPESVVEPFMLNCL